jgi:ribosome-binding protein aMBF1 (putative translation factor)
MKCDVCKKEIGPKGWYINVKPKKIKGCKECMEIVETLIKEGV